MGLDKQNFGAIIVVIIRTFLLLHILVINAIEDLVILSPHRGRDESEGAGDHGGRLSRPDPYEGEIGTQSGSVLFGNCYFVICSYLDIRNLKLGCPSLALGGRFYEKAL